MPKCERCKREIPCVHCDADQLKGFYTSVLKELGIVDLMEVPAIFKLGTHKNCGEEVIYNDLHPETPLCMVCGEVKQEDIDKYAHRLRFSAAFTAMLKEMDRHQPSRGNSWETMPITDLTHMLYDAVNNHLIDESHSLDIANLAVAIHLRRKNERLSEPSQ